MARRESEKISCIFARAQGQGPFRQLVQASDAGWGEELLQWMETDAKSASEKLMFLVFREIVTKQWCEQEWVLGVRAEKRGEMSW